MQTEYLKRRFEVKDDLHRLISGIELSRSLKTQEKEVKDGVNQLLHTASKYYVCYENCIREVIQCSQRQLQYAQYAQ